MGTNMKVTVGEIRKVVHEAMVTASSEYEAKERIRQKLQDTLTRAVATGKVKDQKSLEKKFDVVQKNACNDPSISDVVVMAMSALRMIPFDVWVKMAAMMPKK